MNTGIHFVNFSLPGGTPTIAPTLAETAAIADEGGVAVFSLMDHYFQMEAFAAATEPMLEGYTALGFLAGLTRHVKLNLLVTGVSYRHPGLLAKIVTTLDVLSGGRAQLGIGAAWYEKEHLGLGVPFPSVSERFERLEETLQICRQMWSDNDGPFEGTHYQLAETICRPRPLSLPGPPILIGGSGEKKTLKLVARYGDACNLFAMDYDTVAHKLEVLARNCETEGRSYEQIDKTILAVSDPLADPDAFVAEMARYASLGISTVDLVPRSGSPVEFATSVVEQLVPRLSELD